MILKKITILLLALFALQSCMLTTKMDKIVAGYYAKKGGIQPVDNKNNFGIDTDSLPHINGFCKSRYKNFYTVPLVLYYYSTENIKCTVNSKFYVNAIVNQLNKQLENKKNKEKLDGKSIELTFKQIPTTFNHQFVNHTILFQFFFIQLSSTFSKNDMFYPASSIKVNYVIRDNATLAIIKQGIVNQAIPAVTNRKQRNQRRKVFVENFVTSFDVLTETFCQLTAQQLISEL